MLSVYLLGFVQRGALLIFAAGTGGSPALSPHNLLPLRVFAELLHGSSPLTIARNGPHPQHVAIYYSLHTPSGRSFPDKMVRGGQVFCWLIFPWVCVGGEAAVIIRLQEIRGRGTPYFIHFNTACCVFFLSKFIRVILSTSS